MWIPVVVLFAGLILAAWGSSRREYPTDAPTVPPEEIDDGDAVPPPASRRPGSVSIVLGTILLIIGGLMLLAFVALQGAFDLKLGRPLRVRGRPRQCRRRRGPGWHDDANPSLDKLGAWACARSGERWLAAARAEHASVPAFRRLEQQLLAVGAPAALVGRCEAAARDEIRHARRCFALARAYSGIDWTAGSLPTPEPEPVDLTSLAIESLVDGCIGEGIAADVARAGAARAADPVIRESLAMIADDEAVHAELSWDILAFCIDRGGPDVQRAVIDALPAAYPVLPGPTELDHSGCRRIADARLATVRERVAHISGGTRRADRALHRRDLSTQ